MEALKFMLDIKSLSYHDSAEELYNAKAVGRSVIVGRVLSISNTIKESAPLKCVRILEEPPINMSHKNKETVDIYLRKDFAKIKLEAGSLIAVNPEAVSKSRHGVLQASLGFSDKNLGHMWIARSPSCALKGNRSGQEDLVVECYLKEECFCLITGWFSTPLVNECVQSKNLKDLQFSEVSSFNLTCKVLMVHHLPENHSVLRVTDGTLFKWPVVYFDGLSFRSIASMDRKTHFVDVFMVKTDGVHRVQENVVVKLYGVEVKRFESESGVYCCFRVSGDPNMFRALPQNHYKRRQIDTALKNLTGFQKIKKLSRNCPSTSKSRRSQVPKLSVYIEESDSSSDCSNVVKKKACFNWTKRSPLPGFSENPNIPPIIYDTPSRKRPLRRARAVPQKNITEERRTSISRASNRQEIGKTTTTASHTYDFDYQSDKDLYTCTEDTRLQKSNADHPVLNRRGDSKLPKSGVPVDPCCSVNFSNRSSNSCSTMFSENTSSSEDNPTEVQTRPAQCSAKISRLVDNPLLPYVKNYCYKKQQPPWTAESVLMKPVNIFDMESNDGPGASGAPDVDASVMVSDWKCASQASKHHSKGSDRQGAVKAPGVEARGTVLDPKHASQASKHPSEDSDLSLNLHISEDECSNDSWLSKRASQDSRHHGEGSDGKGAVRATDVEARGFVTNLKSSLQRSKHYTKDSDRHGPVEAPVVEGRSIVSDWKPASPSSKRYSEDSDANLNLEISKDECLNASCDHEDVGSLRISQLPSYPYGSD